MNTMNQAQRKFLLEAVEKAYRKQKHELARQEPEAPSLDRRLVMALLSGTAELRSQEDILAHFVNEAKNLRGEQSLLDDNYGRRKGPHGLPSLSVETLAIFQPPLDFEEALNLWKAEHEAWSEKKRRLESDYAALKLKIQLGSAKSLAGFIDQADSLCELTLDGCKQLALS